MDSNEGYRCLQGTEFGWDEELAARLFSTFQEQLRDISDKDRKDLLETLLKSAHTDSIESMLDYLFDDFVHFLGFNCFLSLKNKCHDHKFLCILIRKIEKKCKEDCGNAILVSLQCSGQQWSAFAAIIEGLENKESSMVVRVLKKQLPKLELTSTDLDLHWLAWLRILCIRLLQENRVLVLLEVLQYFLTHLSVAQLSRFNLVPEVVKATNRTELFDFRYYNCLQVEELYIFLTDCKVLDDVLLESLAAVSWESVPLLHWLCSIHYKQVKFVSMELFIKLCLRVRALKNSDLRGGAQYALNIKFMDVFERLPLREFMATIESLYNKGDSCNKYIYDGLKEKIRECIDLENHLDCFNKNTFEIFFTYGGDAFKQDMVIDFLINFIREPHELGFWRLVLYNDKREVFNDFYREMYKVDISLLQKGAKLEDMQQHLRKILKCQTDEEISFLNARCVDLFICNLSSWRQLEELNLDPLELLRQGTDGAIIGLAKLLETHDKRLKDENILPALIASVRRHKEGKSILKYAESILTTAELERILPQKPLKHIPLPTRELGSHFYTNWLIQGEVTDRIEYVCALSLLEITPLSILMKIRIRNYICENNLIKTGSEIAKELLKVNETLSINHPNYTEFSEVHIQKMQIAFALLDLNQYCSDFRSLKTLINDQLNVKIIHEYLKGCSSKTIDWALKELLSMEPRKQESRLFIAQVYMLENWEKLAKKKLFEIFTLLLPLTRVPSDHTRNLAQLILHKLAVKFENESIHFQKAVDLKNNVEALLGEKIAELQKNEPRLDCIMVLYEKRKTMLLYFKLLYLIKPPIENCI